MNNSRQIQLSLPHSKLQSPRTNPSVNIYPQLIPFQELLLILALQ